MLYVHTKLRFILQASIVAHIVKVLQKKAYVSILVSNLWVLPTFTNLNVPKTSLRLQFYISEYSHTQHARKIQCNYFLSIQKAIIKPYLYK
jgi:hypothetical protein